MRLSFFALAFVSLPAFAEVQLSPDQQKLFQELSQYSGTYVVTMQSDQRPCQAMGPALQAHDRIDLTVKVQEKTDEFFKEGDILVTLEQSLSGKSLRVFDRAPFFAINKGTRRSGVLQMGMLISHQSLYDSSNRVLTHTVTTTGITGGEQALQQVQFTRQGGLVYDYTYYTRNALGYTTETHPSDHCEFRKLAE